MELTVLYFAHLREQRGCDSERIASTATTARELYRELARRHGLTLAESGLAVAVNESVGRWDTAVGDGDTVAFLPPISGG